jgi:hypothetical protein
MPETKVQNCKKEAATDAGSKKEKTYTHIPDEMLGVLRVVEERRVVIRFERLEVPFSRALQWIGSHHPNDIRSDTDAGQVGCGNYQQNDGSGVEDCPSSALVPDMVKPPN